MPNPHKWRHMAVLWYREHTVVVLLILGLLRSQCKSSLLSYELIPLTLGKGRLVIKVNIALAVFQSDSCSELLSRGAFLHWLQGDLVIKFRWLNLSRSFCRFGGIDLQLNSLVFVKSRSRTLRNPSEVAIKAMQPVHGHHCLLIWYNVKTSSLSLSPTSACQLSNWEW